MTRRTLRPDLQVGLIPGNPIIDRRISGTYDRRSGTRGEILLRAQHIFGYRLQ